MCVVSRELHEIIPFISLIASNQDTYEENLPFLILKSGSWSHSLTYTYS